MSFDVFRARRADVDAVHALLAAAGRHLAAGGFRNWLPPYPRERVAADVAERAVFLVRAGAGTDAAPGALVATYALRRAPVRPYVPAPWADPAAPACYRNRLAVDPRTQGQGVGAWCRGSSTSRRGAGGRWWPGCSGTWWRRAGG